MAIAVGYGSDNDFNALVYGQKNPNTINYFEQQAINISQTLTDAGRAFFSNAKDLFEKFNSAEAMRLARAAVRKASSLFQSDSIRSIWDLGSLQTAPMSMQRFIMAEPTVRQMYHEQRCDGYSDTYVDMHPGTIGKDHYDYRRVMNGMVVIDDDGEEKVTFYLDELLEGDRELDIGEKKCILNTWEIVADLMQYGKNDPTSIYDNKL